MCPDRRARVIPAALAVLLGCAPMAGPAAASMRLLPGASTEVGGIAYAHPSSIRFAETEGLFYVADTGNRRIVLLHANLEPLDAISLVPLGLRPFCALPAGDGSCWVSDLDRPDLYRVTGRGDCVDTLRLGPQATPGRMTWEAPGRLLVIDRASRSILRFDLSLEGAAPENLVVPGTGVIEDVAATANGEIDVVSATGSPIWSRDPRSGSWKPWGEHGVAADQFSFPVAICPDRSGGFWLVDAFRHEIRLLGGDREIQERVSPVPGQVSPLQFPVSAGQAAADTITVLERGACRVQRFARLP